MTAGQNADGFCEQAAAHAEADVEPHAQANVVLQAQERVALLAEANVVLRAQENVDLPAMGNVAVELQVKGNEALRVRNAEIGAAERDVAMQVEMADPVHA